jgi:hypothetical protein
MLLNCDALISPRTDQLEDVAVELSDAEAAMLDGLRLPVYGVDDGAALRDILFT